MSIIIGPFSPTANNAQFNDQLYLQSGAYIIHNPTSYQLNFKKADSNRFIVDPGTVRVVHKVGGNSGNVEWTAALVGPLAILNTPGFTIEILQQGVDDIPGEAIVSLSQIATQQPRAQMVPMPAPVTTPITISIASGGADLTTTIGTIPFPVNEAFPVMGFWLFGFTIDAVNTSAAAGELWVITVNLNLSLLLAGVIQGTPTVVYKVNLTGVGPTLSNPVRVFPSAPIVKYIFANGADSLALQVVTHISVLAAARAVVQTNNFYYDVDLSNTNLPPGPGGGISSLTAGFPTQYAGNVW